MRPACDSCALLAPGGPAEQYLFAPNELTHRKWRRDADKCGTCGDNAITLLQLMGGATPQPSPPAAGQGRRDGLRVHYFTFAETEDDFAAFIVATRDVARRAAEVVRGVPVLHARGDDEVYAGCVLGAEVECVGPATGPAHSRLPMFIKGPRPLGDYWFDGIDLDGRGWLWLFWTDEDNAHPATIRRLKMLVRAAAEFWMRVCPDIRWDGCTVPRPESKTKTKTKTKPRRVRR